MRVNFFQCHHRLEDTHDLGGYLFIMHMGPVKPQAAYFQSPSWLTVNRGGN